MSDAKPIVEMKDVDFSYDHKSQALKDIDLTIFEKDFVGVVGPNGGGKSTLLKLMLGFVKPDSGSIKLFSTIPKKSTHKVGYVPQFANFNGKFPISVEEVVLIGRLGKGFSLFRYSKEDKEKTKKILDRLGVGHLKDQDIQSLSGGQLQRVLIARSLVNDPALLILDEPTASVDHEGEEGIFELLAELNKDLAIVIVSHDVSYISKYVKRVICVNKTLAVHPNHEFVEGCATNLYGYDVHKIDHTHSEL